MLKLKKVELTEAGLESTYDVIHNVSHLPTTLSQDLELVVNPETGKVHGRMVLDNLSADSLEDAIEKMAEWCDRIAAGLRQPRKVICMAPMYGRIPFEKEQMLPSHQSMFDALAADLKTCTSFDEIRERIRALVAAKHPLVYVSGALDSAEHQAILRLEEAQESKA